jgi:1-acyl-sn-glycerol-3-phosphate acyltransferase
MHFWSIESILSELENLTSRKKQSPFLRQAIIAKEQLKLIRGLGKDADIEKRLVSSIIRKAEQAWAEKDLEITLDEFRKLQSEKNIEQNIAYKFSHEIQEFIVELRNLEKYLERLSGRPDENIVAEDRQIFSLKNLLKNFEAEKDWLNKYIKEISSLKYNKKLMSSAVFVSKFIKGLFRLHATVEGLENIPRNGPCILMARHYHFPNDFLVLNSILPRKLFFFAGVENFVAPIIGKFAYKVGGIPIKALNEKRLASLPYSLSFIEKMKSFDSSNKDSFRRFVWLLHHGEAILAFPEGRSIKYRTLFSTKSLDAEFSAPNSGGIYLALLYYQKYGGSIPVIPIGLNYTDASFRNVIIKVGAPMHLNYALASEISGKAFLERYIAEIFSRIQALSSSA